MVCSWSGGSGRSERKKDLNRSFTISPDNRKAHFNALYLHEDSKTLSEITVTGQRSQMKLEVDRKTFTVDQMIASAGGSASELLEQIPSIEVTQQQDNAPINELEV